MMFKKNIRGQGTLEFALLMVIVVAALIAMQIYVKRGVEGKLRENTDSIGEQFEAEHTSLLSRTTGSGLTTQTVGVMGAGVTNTVQNVVRGEGGNENVAAW